MTSETSYILPDHIAQKASEHPAVRSIRRKPKIFADTSDFTAIDYGDIIFVDNRYFLVTGYTREGRFGVDDQPKQWVPRVMDLANSNYYILKLVFHEKFTVTIGDFTVLCYRSPEKEAKILKLVQRHERFMQGYTVEDTAGNPVRILDIIRGKRLDKYISSKGATHQEYFEEHLPGILRQFLECVKGISFLHSHGLKHGDIRRDHILIESDTGLFKWIDFDYDFYLPERPYALDIFELGNLLMFLVGRGTFTQRDVLEHSGMGEKVLSAVASDDYSLVSSNKIVNLGKLFPYVPKELNDIFLHFSSGTRVFYDDVDEFLQDLGSCVTRL